MKKVPTKILEVKTIKTDAEINSFIKKGWKLLSTCTYYSPNENCVLSAATMGKPWALNQRMWT